MRKNWKWIVFISLIVSITGVFWLLFGRGWISPGHLRVGSLDALESLPPVDMPITTASEAIKFAYEKEEVHKWLYSVSSEDLSVPVRVWDITASHGSGDIWKVKFLSLWIIPSTICVASFDIYGKEELTSGRPNNYCEWQK